MQLSIVGFFGVLAVAMLADQIPVWFRVAVVISAFLALLFTAALISEEAKKKQDATDYAERVKNGME